MHVELSVYASWHLRSRTWELDKIASVEYPYNVDHQDLLMLCSCNVGRRRLSVLGSIDREFLISGICGVTWYVIAYQVLDTPVWIPVVLAKGTLSLVEVKWRWASIPRLRFLFFSMWHVGVSKCMDRSCAIGWWTPNLLFVVWWFVVSVFWIVDGTGMFECVSSGQWREWMCFVLFVLG